MSNDYVNNEANAVFGPKFLGAAEMDGMRPYYESVLKSIKKAVDAWDWRVIVSISRKLYANMGVPRGAINLKAMLATGEAWEPIYLGKDIEWGAEAKTWLLDSFYPVYNVRGPLFDFKTDRYLDSITTDRCGDFFYFLTKSDLGFPMAQAVPNHLVRTPPLIRDGTPCTIRLQVPRYLVDGQTGDPVTRDLSAAAVHNGVAFSATGRPFAYCVYEEALDTFLPSEQTKFRWVHETWMVHAFDVEWYEQGRGFPAFTHAVRQFISMLTSQEFEEITHMIMSSISVVEHNEEGGPDTNDPTQAIGRKPLVEQIAAAENGEIPDVVIQKIVGGLGRYFKASSGSKIETPLKSSPGPMWDSFQDRLTRIALVGANMPPSIVWKGSEENGTTNRVSIEKLHRVVLDRQSLLSYPATRIVRYGLAVAMKTDRLRRSDDWYNWGFSVPPEFIIDDGKIAKSDREDYGMGIQNLTGILARKGRTLVPHFEERAEEEAQKQLAAKRVTKKYASEGVIVTPEMLGRAQASSAPSSKSEGEGDASESDGGPTPQPPGNDD